MFRSIANFRALSFLSIALAIYAAARLLPVSAGLTPGGQAVLGVVFAGVVLWISEAVPLGQTALVVLVSLGTVPNAAGSVTFIGFASPVVFFLIGAVAIGAAVESSGLAERLAKLLVRGARGNPARLYAQMLASLPGLALLLPSAITRNAVLIPAYRDSLAAMGISQSGRTGRAIMLALGVLNPLASSALLTGGITSMTASVIIGDFSWIRWFGLMSVPYYTLLCLGGFTLRLLVGRFEEQRDVQVQPALDRSLSPKEVRTILVLVVISTLWLTDFIHGLSPAIPALLGAVLLTCPKIGVLGWRELESRLSWGLVLTVGASLSLSQAMVHTGTADWLGQNFLLLLAGVTQSPLTLLTGIIICVATVHLAITNLAACIALLVPITMTIAKTAGVNPIVCALAVTIVIDSVILYPVQTAANLIAYESGYFGTADVGRLGFAMLGLTIFVSLCVAVPYWSALGLPLVSG